VSPVKYEMDFYIPEDIILHTHSGENYKYYKIIIPQRCVQNELGSDNFIVRVRRKIGSDNFIVRVRRKIRISNIWLTLALHTFLMPPKLYLRLTSSSDFEIDIILYVYEL
jgi:hypothetical protein